MQSPYRGVSSEQMTGKQRGYNKHTHMNIHGNRCTHTHQREKLLEAMQERMVRKGAGTCSDEARIQSEIF